ncbi:MAG: tRNA adenosine(34) deaminase TadA [Candidatus Binatia bacterium]
MSAALSAARRAERLGEVPIGAIVVIGGEIIARGHNETIRAHDPTAHAEILAIRRAARKLGTHRLVDAELHVTLEPCAMCVGAMIQARIRALHFACRDPKAGAVVSVHQLASDRRLNHRIPLIREGALAEECRTLLQSFFRARRAEQR